MRVSLTAAAVLAAALAAPGVADAEVVVSAVDGSNTWSQPVVRITEGETVRWTFAGTVTPHNVESAGAGWAPALTSPPTFAGPDQTYTFKTRGNYAFVCSVHRDTMTGTVEVAGADGTPPPPPPPPPPSEQPFANDIPPLTVFELRDTVVPKLDRVKMSRVKRGVKVRFRLSEGGKVTVKATRGRSVVKRTVELEKGRRSVTLRGLKAGRYRVQVSATDLAGNAAKARPRTSVTVGR